MLGWQDYAVADPAMITRKVRETDLPLSLSLGILGLNGVTAYFGLLDLGRPKPGDTVVVSTAAGAVGSAVGQIAKLSGCRTVGIAGGRPSARICVEDFGYDAAIDYKAADFKANSRRPPPNGVDVYFDNTAGAISDAVLRGSPSAPASSSAAPHRFRAGTRRRWVRASSVISWSSARACPGC